MLDGTTGTDDKIEDPGANRSTVCDILEKEDTASALVVEPTVTAVEMHPGEILLAYSDGVTEPENDYGEFGEERLIELVRENRDLPLARITEIVTAAVSAENGWRPATSS